MPAVIPKKKSPMQRLYAKGRLPLGVMNATERAFAQHLEMLKRAGEIVSYDFEKETFKLGKCCTYTPDFRVLMPDGGIVFYEVKGYWLDDAKVKIKVAAEQNRMYRFIAVMKKTKKEGGGWSETEF